jgi:ABC-2 type transport system permease protein
MSRLGAVVRKEFQQMRRDPVLIRMTIIAPLMQLLLLGYAATNDVRNIPVAIYDGDRSADSRLLAELITHNHYFRVVPAADDPRGLEQLLLAGKAQIGISLPQDFHRARVRGETPVVGLLVDGTDSNTVGVATAYLLGILRQQGVRWQLHAAQAAGLGGAALPQVLPEPRVWYNPELKSANFMVPGVLGMILLTLTVNTAALAIVREREGGTLEQLLVTPLRPRELIIGKLVPLVLLSYIEMLLVLALARGWFRVPLHGSVSLLLVVSFVFLVSALGLGLLISAAARSQQEAQVISFLLVTTSVLLAGFMFPTQNMPLAVQYLTYAIPFRYYLEIVRGVFLRGVGIEVLWPQIAALTGISLVLLGLGIASFRKRL